MSDPIIQILTPFTFSEFYCMHPKSMTELRMMAMSQEIRSKRGWTKKMKNPEIVERWKSEASSLKLSREDIEYVLDELKYYAKQRTGGIEMGAVDGTWQGYDLLSCEKVKKFKETVYELLEDVSEEKKDYHPGSNGQVVDLVHPSLFCYIFGVTQTVHNKDATHYRKIQISENRLFKRQWPDTEESFNYQWLPSEFKLDSQRNVTISSYINNLHPKNQKTLYPLIGEIFELFVPLFENVLTDLVYRRDRIEMQNFNCNEGLKDPYDSDCSEGYRERWWTREVSQPKAPEFKAPPPKTERISLSGRNLQVIVKLANIELTPEKPDYPGGVWHVEGTHKEAIVASGIYYYSIDNVSKSRLMFRQAVSEPYYEQNDDVGPRTVYGFEDGDHLNQTLGSAITEEGKFLAFPNVYQHCVAPFGLVDRTQKGHRKILVFFLVDPRTRIFSTYDVEPQQREWFCDGSIEYGGDASCTMTLEEAKRHRKALMFERKYFRNLINQETYERPWSLCEH